jgi:hypothetical protein
MFLTPFTGLSFYRVVFVVLELRFRPLFDKSFWWVNKKKSDNFVVFDAKLEITTKKCS